MVGITEADQRAARLRRVWRLALLLSGDVGQAAMLYRAVGGSTRIETVDAVRLDRLVVLEHRERQSADADDAATDEVEPETASRDGHIDESGKRLTAGEAYAALERATAQGRLAWLLRRVEGMAEVEAARAMDCSKTALNTHLQRAEATLSGIGADGQAMAEAIGRWVDSAASGCPADPRIAQRRARRRRLLGVLIAIAAAAGAVGIWLALR